MLRGLGTNRGRKAFTSHSCRHWIEAPTRSTMPYFQLKTHHVLLFVIDLEAAQIRWNCFTTRRTEVADVTTQFRPSSSQRSTTSKTDQKGSEKHNQKKE